MTSNIFFLHGLDSSSKGTKGRFFTDNFPEVISSDYTGTLANRLQQLHLTCGDCKDITLIGSSFGGLMATCYAISHPEKINQLILMAPALNYGNYKPPIKKLLIPTLIVIGTNDVVTPPNLVVPLAEETFTNLEIQLPDDDHMLHLCFEELDWHSYLAL